MLSVVVWPLGSASMATPMLRPGEWLGRYWSR